MVITTPRHERATPAARARQRTSSTATPEPAPGHRRPSLGLLKTTTAAVIAIVMADTMAITMALPLLRQDPITQAVPFTEVSLLTTVNLAAVAALLVSAGRLADLLGRRAVLAVGLALFAAGALAMVFGPVWPVVLAGRLVQGVGTALMLPSALGLLLGHVGEQKRRGAVALWGSATGSGGLLMHALGGPMLDGHGWRALYLPLALAALALLLLVAALPRSRAAQRVMPDLLGMTALVAATTALVLVISFGGRWGWSSLATAAAVAVALGGFWLALARSGRHPAGAIDQVLWRYPGFRWGLVTSLLYGMVAYPGLTLAPLVLRERGMSVTGVGLALAPMSATLIVSSLLASRLIRRLGISATMYAGAYVSAVGFLIVFATPRAPWGSLIGLAVLGVGFGLVSTAASIAGTADVDPAHYGAAVGAITTGRMLGAAIGPAIAIAYLAGTGQRPGAGYRDILVGCVVMALLLTACALVRTIQRVRARRASAAAPAQPAADPAVGTPQDVARLRDVLQRQRARLEAIARAAETELAALTSSTTTAPAPARATPRAADPAVPPSPSSSLFPQEGAA
ncbi:MFS transporter [Nonomuraea sp. NPDC003707]